MSPDIHELYAEACRALGEAVTANRVLSAAVEQLTAENEALRAQVAAPQAD